MTRPVRLTLSRAKGFDLQALSQAANGLPAVKVTRPGRFGNPFTIEAYRRAGYMGSDQQIAPFVVRAFARWLESPDWRAEWDSDESARDRAALLSGLPSLRGKNLACWCKPGAPCHADVLLEIANRPTCEEA